MDTNTQHNSHREKISTKVGNKSGGEMRPMTILHVCATLIEKKENFQNLKFQNLQLNL